MTSNPDREAQSVVEALRNNYNTTGVAVMQAMYSDDYLSIGGTASTDTLARLARISSSSRVLDIGCGVGGPALHVAAIYGCHVTGIDLVDSSIALARASARERGLAERTRFEVADAASLPFSASSFDVVYGQDAWCHIPDKDALIAQCARVLRPGGTIAFTDWVRLRDDNSAALLAALEAALSNDAASMAQYQDLLSKHGFIDVDREDLSETFARQYQTIYRRLTARREQLVEQFSERVFNIVADMNGEILRGFEGGHIGGARFVARKAG